MPIVVFFNSYKLKKDISIPDFLLAAERLNAEFISKQKGYISFKLFSGEKTWADAITFETMEDAKNFEEGSWEADDLYGLAEKFYSFIKLGTCESHFYTLEKDCGNE